jgi:uncharacterized membrane protein
MKFFIILLAFAICQVSFQIISSSGTFTYHLLFSQVLGQNDTKSLTGLQSTLIIEAWGVQNEIFTSGQGFVSLASATLDDISSRASNAFRTMASKTTNTT